MDDIYKVKGYSDKELYDILDLVNPSDRELEAKILHMIWKYDNMGNSQHLSTFFRDIYDHFFEEEEEEEKEKGGVIEGFTTEDIQTVISSGTTASTGSNINNTIPTTKPAADTEKKDDKAVLGYSFPLDYTKDSLNPLLKQTTKRIVSIDSQYRDRTKYPLSSQYTFNLSNPLKDVVNLRLYSIQIPYTWYTINDSYGSNFFYLKGNSPGIDNGFHDIKVEIGIGNYTAPGLIDEIDKSIIALRTNPEYSDISFGETKMNYGIASSKATLDLKFKKRYDESFYSMEFSDWTSPRTNTDASGSIPAFLGLDLQKYNAHSIISNIGRLPWPEPSALRRVLDTSNNFITIVHYLPNNGDTSIEYTTDIVNPKFTVLETIPITLSLTPSPTSLYSVIDIKNDLNNQLNLNTKLINSSVGNFKAPVESFPGNPKSYYVLDIRLNRTNTKNVPNSKVAVVFNESPTQDKIWTGPDSMFAFEQKNDTDLKIVNEANTILSKVRTVQRQIDIQSSPQMNFKCLTPYFNGRDLSGNIISNTDLSMNDFGITIPNQKYT